jgi:hypothetical protein
VERLRMSKIATPPPPESLFRPSAKKVDTLIRF